MNTFRPVAVLAGLWALAVAHPILDALRRAPEFFVAHRADAIDAAILAAALTLGGPAALAAVVLLARAVSRTLVEPVMAVLVGTIGAVFVVQLAYRLGVESWIGAAIVMIAAAGTVAFASLRFKGFRTFLLVLWPAAVVVPLVFLLGGPLRSSGAGQLDDQAAGVTARATPVVIVVFDELSLVSLLDDSGKLNAVRYPNFAALAGDGIWFRNATAVSDYTIWALPSIVTGRYPASRTTPTPQDHPHTVFSLAGRSHRLEVSEAVTGLCPRQLCGETGTPRFDRESAMAADVVVVAGHVFLPPSARAALPDLTQNWAGFGAADDTGDTDDEPDGQEATNSNTRVIRPTRNWRQRWRGAVRGTNHLGAAEAFIDGISPDDHQPTLYFIHTLVSHQPLRWMPSGQRITNYRSPSNQPETWPNVEWLVAQHHHAELLQAALADALIGRVRDRLTSAGLYEHALIVVTADHGMAMRPDDRLRGFTATNAAEILSVPLIVKPPAATSGVIPGTVEDANAETIDVLPTVARVLGLDVRWPADGRSLIGSDPPRPEKRFFYNSATRTATFRPDELSSERDRAARRQAEIFGLDRWPAFTVPGLRALIGRDVASFGDIPSLDTVGLTIEARDALSHVDPQAPEIPAQLWGRFAQSESAGRFVVAVAMNGRVVATTRARPGTARWMVMLPPDAFRAGANEVEAFLLDPKRPDQLLRPRQ